MRSRLPNDLMHSSLRQHFNPGGTPKRRFDTFEEAQVFAEELNALPSADPRRPREAYECETCAKFHIGKRPLPKTKTKKRKGRR